MKQFIASVIALLLSANGFANITSPSPLKALGSAWKTPAAHQIQQTKNDITMVYGGADISRRPTLDPRSTTA